MNTPNHLSSPEESPVTREQVISAFKPFIERGITNPDDLELDDPEVIEANRLLDVWDAEQRKISDAAGTVEADLEYALNRSIILLDAGFSDPVYLEEVANDWLLENDLPRAQQAGLTEMAGKIQAKIDEINGLLYS
jgi:hypothetical protein